MVHPNLFYFLSFPSFLFFSLLICAGNLVNTSGAERSHQPPLSSGEMGTPSPRSEQLHTMGNHTPNGIRAHNDRHTLANEPGNLHAMSNHTKNDTQGAHRPQHHHPVGLSHI